MSTADVKLSTSLSTVACVSEEVLACVEEVFACVTESWHPVKSGIDSTPATMNASTLFFMMSTSIFIIMFCMICGYFTADYSILPV